MTLFSRLMGRIAKLPPAETFDVITEHDLNVPMPDGAILLANRYAPRGVEKPPLILVRSCYGRVGLLGLLYGRIFAERGFQVLIQSTRGTFGSTGPFEPLVTAVLVSRLLRNYGPQLPRFCSMGHRP